MKRKILFVSLLLALGTGGYLAWAGSEATCSGGNGCNACKNCKYCGHCAKKGGSCSVCR